jgi:hypothetical protein
MSIDFLQFMPLADIQQYHLDKILQHRHEDQRHEDNVGAKGGT